MKLAYRPEIDGLRAIAVLAVIFFHSGSSVFSGGFVGVDVFFVISGYLITSIVLNEIEDGAFSYGRFYERRVRRLLPAMFVVVLATIPFAWLFMFPGQFKDFMGSVFANSVFLSNFYFLSQVEYFQPQADLQPLLHTWSLSIEEQYYLLFPFAAVVLARGRRRILFLATVAFVLWGIWLSHTGVTDDPGKNYFHTMSRLWEIGAGSLCAFAKAPFRVRSAPVLAALGLVLILVSIGLFGRSTPFPSLYTLLPVVGTMLLVLFGTPQNGVGRILSLRPVVFVGLLSYSAYLWHQPLLALARLRKPTDLVTGDILGLVLFTFVLAFLSWKYVEQPVRFSPKWKAIGRRRLFAVSGVALFCFAALGLSGYLNDGFLGVGSDRTQLTALEARLAPNYGLSEGCASQAPTCRTDSAPEVLLWGDSYAMHLAPALIAANPDVKLEQHTFSGCAPLPGLAFLIQNMLPGVVEGEIADCLAFNAATLEHALTSDTLRTVVISSPFAAQERQLWTEAATPIDPESALSVIARNLEDTISQLSANGLQVVLVTPPPENGSDLGQCAAKVIRFNVPQDSCDFARGDAQNAYAFEMLETVQGDYDRINLGELICPDQHCAVITSGAIVYRDQGHLSLEGSAWLGQTFNGVFSLPKD